MSAARPGLTARPGSSPRTSAHTPRRLIRDSIIVGLTLGLCLALIEPASRLIFGVPSWAPADLRVTNHGGASYNLPLVPYGIERGLCDRPLVMAEFRADPRHALIAGDTVGARMDMVDQRCVGSTLEFAPDDRRILWRNPDTGISYAVAATRTYQNARGAYCREFDASAVQGSQLRQIRGIACRSGDGTWAAIR